VLYAILVEGQGPLGTTFRPDDFTDKEVRDTDHDGLPEFVDAWGQPLQFYRWPILFHSDVQRGQQVTVTSQSPPQVTFGLPYNTVFETREQDPLDANQQLVAPTWWNVRPGCAFFEQYFHTLHEPTSPTGTNNVNLWDRSTSTNLFTLYPRRAFYTKFLIASAGPDAQSGIYQAFTTTTQPTVNAANIALLIQESYACQFDPSVITSAGNAVTSQLSVDLQNQGQDDITNHNLMAPGGGMQ
jgi:hypothetical protein